MQNNDLNLLKNINALYVDDDETTQKEYGKLFEKFFKVLYLEDNPIKALKSFNTRSIQLIITDLKMPYMNGIEFVKEIRKTNKKIPIFIMSAYPDQNSLMEAIGLDLVSFLIKPVSYSKLKDSLIAVLEKIIENNLLNIIIDSNTSYNPIEKKIYAINETYSLQNKESLLLELFLKNKNKLIEKSTIEYHLYEDEVMTDAALKNLLLKLRKKLPKGLIVSFKNLGYTMVVS